MPFQIGFHVCKGQIYKQNYVNMQLYSYIGIFCSNMKVE